ncbi:MAG TPA: hypothetical protein VLA56_16590 [Pseudomonadales bacterium]|nr:hypothetical protein [Pseudomonadales bacterium]
MNRIGEPEPRRPFVAARSAIGADRGTVVAPFFTGDSPSIDPALTLGRRSAPRSTVRTFRIVLSGSAHCQMALLV